MTTCPKFETCSTPICPLDPLWPSAYYRPGERVCQFLLATGKAGADERYADDPVFTAARTALPLIVAAYPGIGTAVAGAAKKGFPGDQLANWRQQAVNNGSR